MHVGVERGHQRGGVAEVGRHSVDRCTLQVGDDGARLSQEAEGRSAVPRPHPAARDHHRRSAARHLAKAERGRAEQTHPMGTAQQLGHPLPRGADVSVPLQEALQENRKVPQNLLEVVNSLQEKRGAVLSR